MVVARDVYVGFKKEWKQRQGAKRVQWHLDESTEHMQHMWSGIIYSVVMEEWAISNCFA